MNQRIDRHAEGFYVIAATPFDEGGALDLDSADRLTGFYLDCGVSGMTILGVMGEAQKLAGDEARAFAARVLARAAGRVPVIVGVSAPGVANLASLARFAMDKGAAGVMVAPMAGLATEEKVADYMAQVCAALGPDIPVCLQDNPQATGVQVSAATVLRLAADHPQIVMFKHEDCPGLNKLSRLRAGCRAAPRLSILCGNGGLYLPQELARGADGAMTGFAWPDVLAEVVRRHRAGDPDGAEDLFDAWLPLIRHEQQPGIGLALRKEALRRRGAIACAATRAPGPSLSRLDHEELTRLIARVAARPQAAI